MPLAFKRGLLAFPFAGTLVAGGEALTVELDSLFARWKGDRERTLDLGVIRALQDGPTALVRSRVACGGRCRGPFRPFHRRLRRCGFPPVLDPSH